MSTPANTYGTTLEATLEGKRTDVDGWEHYAWTVTLTRNTDPHLLSKGIGATRVLPYKMGVGNVQTKCGKPLQWNGRYPRVIPCEHVRCHNAGPVPTPPNLYDILTSLKADCTLGETFHDWATDLGMDTDSIRARDLYFACQESERESRRFFGSDWPAIAEDDEYA